MKKTLLILAISTMSSIAHAQVTNGLVARYSFDNGNANDDIGTNNGIINGAVLTADRFGTPNKAYEFDGISNFLDLGSSATIKPVVGTVSLWAKMIAVSNTGSGYNYNPLFLSKNSSENSFFEGACIYIRRSDNKLLTVTTDSSTITERFIYSTNTITVGTWQHFMMTYDNDSLSLYVNGQLQSRIFKGFASSFSTSEPVYVAKSGNSLNNRYFNGALDDIRIYNRVLSPTEIATLYVEGNPVATGVNEYSNTNHSIGIYPNPTMSQINLSTPSNAQLSDVTGKILLSLNNVSTFNISEQAPGLYILTLSDNTGKILQRNKIVKE